ncbi:MAG: hypothetical protein K2L22_06375, partial [Muribaculaceae bacterium]|nr:hypothetical protein [Muribaculaceae bacterium]
MTELEMMRWVLGILITAGALAVTVMYFFRNDGTPAVAAVETGDNRLLLQQALMSSASDNKSAIPSAILESEVYGAIQRNIREGSIINESNPIWDELEKTIAQSSPKFKSNLYVLSGGDLKPSDLNMALLIKCGVSPANIAMLVGRSKSTITFRRKDMGKKLFNENLDANAVDELIRSL